MIWLLLVAVVFVGGGAWLVARSMRTRILVAVAGVVAVAGYWFVGRPDMPDDPLSGQIGALEAIAKNTPEKITPAQQFALLQNEAHNNPKNPEPDKKIGDLYASNGQVNEAIMSYRAALRRDPGYAPAMDALSELNFLTTGEIDDATRARMNEIRQKVRTAPDSLTSVQLLALLEERLQSDPGNAMAHKMVGEIYESAGQAAKADAAFKEALKISPNDRDILKAVADMRFKSSKTVDAETSDFYHRAYKLDLSDIRVGYMAGVGDWLAGRKDEAKAIWKQVESSPAMDATHAQMFAAMRQMFKIDADAAETPPPADGRKPPQKGK